MSAQPPSGRPPAGPPSGPLSGGEAAPPPPPGDGAGHGGGAGTGSGGGGGSGRGRPRRPGPTGGEPGGGRGGAGPWWRSVPRIASITAVVVAAAALAIVLTRPGGSSGSEVYLQAASEAGPAPFTPSSAKVPATPQPRAKLPASPASPSPAGGNVTRGVDGATPGLYGGTQKLASCDTEQQIRSLTEQPDRNRAFASVLGIEPAGVPDHLRSLTPVTLRMDTRVTNHRYADGAATPYQAVLQAGTAVLVDGRGVPRVRCACGNPLLPPVFVQGPAERTGDSWPGYDAADTVAVTPAPENVEVFVVYDAKDDGYIAREPGDDVAKDKPAPPPRDPSTPVLVPAAPTSASPTGPTGSTTSGQPESRSPGTDSPGSVSPSPKSPGPKSPGTDSPAGSPSPRTPAEDTTPGRTATDGTTKSEPPASPPQPPASTPAEKQEPAPDTQPRSDGPPPQEEQPVVPSLPDIVVPPAKTPTSPAPAT
ncbi:DUF6777 domain-containing protein [Streptomyces sp. NPDC059881]|uniref:DUF6777 domain-containing protein n=1 Tax=Streptomyces sp. NPDC059881 TaxID=3346986 RepID=UPI003656D3B4